MNTERRCGYAVTDSDGRMEPCDRPATGWRWYQDCGHEEILDVACGWHENEGGRRLAAVEAVAVDMDRRANIRSSAYVRAKDVANAIRHALENQ